MRWSAAGLLWLLVSLVTASAPAALPPGEYDHLRQVAPIAFTGVVQHDPGGQAAVRVEHVARGQLMPGHVVTVVYPIERGGPMPVGPQIYYRRFAAGVRVRVFGQSGGGLVVHIVHGGIDVLSAAPAQRGGCASCALGAPASKTSSGAAGLLALASALALAWRRSRLFGGACL